MEKKTPYLGQPLVLIPADGDEATMFNLALDLKDALTENLRVAFSKTAKEIRENDLTEFKKMLETSTDTPHVIKDMIRAGLRAGPKGVVTAEQEVDGIVRTKLPEAIQKQTQIFLGKEGLTQFQRNVIETFASFAPA